MDRSVLARRIAPAAVFVAVLAGVVALGQRGHSHSTTTLHRIALGSSSRTQAGKTGADSAATALAPYYGKVVVPDALLAGLPTEGPVYDVGTAVTADRVAALARALGVTGEPRRDGDDWVVGTGDRVLRVLTTYGANWYLGPDNVGMATDAGSSGGGATGVATATPVTVSAEPVPPCAPPPPDTKTDCVTPVPVSPPPGPTEDVARATADRVFAAAGLAGPRVVVTDGWGSKDVTASPVIGGLATVGFETRVSVDASGDVTYASGFLGTADLDARYPLLDVRAALDRGYGGGIEPMRLGAPCPAEGTCPPVPDRVGTKVELGLLFSPGFAKDAYLAPAWLLSFADSTYAEPVLALPDQYIATPPPPSGDPNEPVCDPAPCPKPSAEPGSAGSGTVDQGSAEPGTAVPPAEDKLMSP